MQAQRKSIYQLELESPGGQVNELFRKTMQPASTTIPVRVLDDEISDLHEKAAEFKQWADGEYTKTGVYPERKALDFIESIKPLLLHLGLALPTD